MAITGIWEGYYFHNWVSGAFADADPQSEWAYGLRLEVIEKPDGSIIGTMTDLRGRHEILARDAYMISKESIGFFEKLSWKSMLFRHPNFVLLTEMPTNSQIEGTVDGFEVSFTKVYDGQILRGWRSGAHTSVTPEMPMPVSYRGVLDPTRSAIAGQFQVLGLNPAKPTVGKFQLQRT